MKVLSSIVSLSLWKTVVAAAGLDDDPVSSFISQRRNLLLKNAAIHGVTRSSSSSKPSDAKTKQILSSLHSKQRSDGSACSDAYEKMYEVYNPDLDLFEFTDFTMIDGINAYLWVSTDESKFSAFSSACEALDGRVEFINVLTDNCYYNEKYDEDFNPTGEFYYIYPMSSTYHQPDCVPNACSTNDEIVNALGGFYYPNEHEHGDKCKFSIEISDEETIEEELECIQGVVDLFFDETLWSEGFADSTIGYDEDTNIYFWMGSDEDLASFDTTCQGLGGSTYLSSVSSNECYYYDYYNSTFSEDPVADWIRVPDCLPKTCASTKDAVDVLEKIYSTTPNCDSLKIKLDLPNGCKDSGVKMRLKRDGVTKKRGCEWILRKEALREKRCGLKEVASHCPSTCNEVTTPNSCEEYSCEDSKMKWARWGKHDKSVLDCDWVKENPDKRCKKNGVAATCRKTCGYKSDFLDCSS